MSLPFSIGETVEINHEKIDTDPELIPFVGRRGKVETMGLRWVKVHFENEPRRFIISTDKLKGVRDEDAHRF